MSQNTADYRCRSCGASISAVSGLCAECEPVLPMVGDADSDTCHECGAFLYSSIRRASGLCLDCDLDGDFDPDDDEESESNDWPLDEDFEP